MKKLIESINRVINRIGRKMAISNYKKLHKDDYAFRSNNECEAVKICRNLITKNPDSDLRIAPLSGNRHIKNERLKMVVFINETSIDIIKNYYPQNVPISAKSHRTILNMFDGYAEMYREREMNEVNSNLKQSIESILKETKNS